MSHTQTNTKQSSSQPFRHVSSIHYNLTNNEECHTKCVSTATAHIHEPPGRTYVSSYYIAIGGISSSESKSDVQTAYTSDRGSKDHFSTSFDRDSDWDLNKKESILDVTRRQESESSYIPYRSGRKDSYSSDYKGSSSHASDVRNVQDSYGSYFSDNQSSNLSSYDTRHSQKQSGSYSFRSQQDSRRDSDLSYTSSDTRTSQSDYTSLFEDSSRKSRRDSGNLAYETRRDSGLSGFETRRDSGLSGFETRRDSGRSGFETRRDSGISSYETRRGSGISAFETSRDSDTSSIYSSSSRIKKETEDIYKKQIDQHMQSIRTEDVETPAVTPRPATDEKRPEFIVKPRKQFGDVGKPAKFKASFEGKGNLRWERYGKVIEQSEKYKLYQSLDFNYLEINIVELSDAGIYICIVENDQGCDTASAVLEVFEDYKPTPPLPPKKPQVDTPLHDIDVNEGATNVELRCKFSNVSSVNWFKDGNKLPPSQDIKSTFDGFNAVLVLKNVTPNAIGCYECIAISSKKEEVQTSCVLTVQSTKPKVEPPIFIRELQDIQCSEGDPLELFVQVKGTHPIDIFWVHNNAEIVPDGKIYKQISYLHNDGTSFIHKLLIEEFLPEDAGEYVCEAYNTYGDTDTFCRLTIKEGRTKSHDSPQILELIPNELSVKSGEAAMFSVKHTGEKVKWYRGRKEVEADDRLIIENKPGFCEFTIQNTLPTDRGSYNVVVTNKLGNDSAIVKLVVEDASIFDHLNVQISTANFEDFYILKEEVGSGRFGVVHKCIEKSSNRLWAAKIIKCKEKKKAEFRNEIEIMKHLTHPKVLRLWDAYESPTGFVIVTEFVCGGELFKRIVDDDFVLTEQDCAHFVHQICEGVCYLHDKQIIHLDLKPENILCIAKSNNFIKIIDFGLARRLQVGDSIKVLFGTPDFIAPEVVNYDEISFATDLWSLGVICYVLISGLAPFTGETNGETLSNVTQAEYDFDDETFDEISDAAKDFISKLLVKKKENRMTIHKCLQHEWLALDHVDNQCMKRLSTDKLKNFIARRKWQAPAASFQSAGGRPSRTNYMNGGHTHQDQKPRQFNQQPSVNRHNNEQKNGTAIRALNHITGRFSERSSSTSESTSFSLPTQYSVSNERRTFFRNSKPPKP
ncbi:myosin light chain kinase, smooth muscle isoform X2 [Octopus bimaculoides]|uniref:myosin light chain kinase, smooth muscle isoform X2 n=1 Tax=Octopus bimaculoides TaxID=37653 RepID=UPI0022E1C624|nr:myosin light chain kinase, smooth muscle isoform X2 [Octopus bimaculoides]